MPDNSQIESLSDVSFPSYDEPGAPPIPDKLSYSSGEELHDSVMAWVKARKEWEAKQHAKGI